MLISQTWVGLPEVGDIVIGFGGLWGSREMSHRSNERRELEALVNTDEGAQLYSRFS